MASIKEKIAYALGDAAAGGIVWKVMSIAFPLFFTNVFGLSFADAAVLMLVARMFDVVTDPLMGSLADRTQSRWARIVHGSFLVQYLLDLSLRYCYIHPTSALWVSASTHIHYIC